MNGTNGVEEMSNLEWKTKKEKILEDARRDPFQKIDKLAKRANTTTRYVRTILSEANLSLMKLRREYARKMEKRYNSIDERLLLGQLLKAPFARNDQIEICQELLFNNPNDLNKLHGNIENNYYYISFLHAIKKVTWSISTVLINKDIVENKEQIEIPEELFKLVGKEITGDGLWLSDICFDIELATSQIANVLKIQPLSPLFRAEQWVERDNEVTMLFMSYFNTKHITFSLSSRNGLIINQKSNTG